MKAFFAKITAFFLAILAFFGLGPKTPDPEALSMDFLPPWAPLLWWWQ